MKSVDCLVQTQTLAGRNDQYIPLDVARFMAALFLFQKLSAPIRQAAPPRTAVSATVCSVGAAMPFWV